MPFDQGRMDDPNPGPTDLFEQAWIDHKVELTDQERLAFVELIDREEKTFGFDTLLSKFADWCYDQGVAEGMAEADTFAEQGR